MPRNFEKRHYEMIAEAIRYYKRSGYTVRSARSVEATTLARIGTTLADMLEDDNPKFDREEFIRRCGWH